MSLIGLRSFQADALAEVAERTIQRLEPRGWLAGIKRLPVRLTDGTGDIPAEDWLAKHPAVQLLLIKDEACSGKTEAMRRLVSGEANRIASGLRTGTLLPEDADALPPVWVDLPAVLSVPGEEQDAETREIEAFGRAGEYERALAAVLAAWRRGMGEGAMARVRQACLLPRAAIAAIANPTGPAPGHGVEPSKVVLAIDRAEAACFLQEGRSREFLHRLAQDFPGQILLTARESAADTDLLPDWPEGSEPMMVTVTRLAEQEVLDYLSGQAGLTAVRGAPQARTPPALTPLKWLTENPELSHACARPGMLVRLAQWSAETSDGVDEHALLNWCRHWELFAGRQWDMTGRGVYDVHHVGHVNQTDASLATSTRRFRTGRTGRARRPMQYPFPSKAPCFVGRDEFVARVCARLAPGARQMIVQAGGAGKTAVCDRAARALVPENGASVRFPDGLVFLNLYQLVHDAKRPRPEAVWRVLAGAFGVTSSPGEPPFQATQRALRDRVALIVVEGAEKAQPSCGLSLREILSVIGPFCAVLIGTRSWEQAVDPTIAQPEAALEVPPLPAEAGRKILLHWSKLPASPDHLKVLDDLAGHLRCHPLALEVSGRYLARGIDTPEEFLDAIRRNPGQTLLEVVDHNTEDERPFGGVFHRVFEKLSPRSQAVVCFAASLSPHPIPLPLLAAAFDSSARQITAALRDTGNFLATRSGSVEFQHQLVRDFAAGCTVIKPSLHDSVIESQRKALTWYAGNLAGWVRPNVAGHNPLPTGVLIDHLHHLRAILSVPSNSVNNRELHDQVAVALFDLLKDSHDGFWRFGTTAVGPAVAALKASLPSGPMSSWSATQKLMMLQVLCTQGDLAAEEDDRGAARKHFGEVCRISKKLAEREPENTVFQSDLAVAKVLLAGLVAQQGRVRMANEILGGAIVVLKKLVNIDPSNADWGADLAMVEEWRAAFKGWLGSPAQPSQQAPKYLSRLYLPRLGNMWKTRKWGVIN